MNLTYEEVRLALYAVTDLIVSRNVGNRPVPAGSYRLRERLDASVRGSELEAAAAQSENDDDDLIDTTEAAELLSCSTRRVRQIASDLDGQSLGGHWVFRRRIVVEYAQMRGHENRTSND